MQPTSTVDSGWHLDKKVPISIIFVLLTYGVSGIWVIADIKRDVELLKAAAIVQQDRDKRQDELVGQAFAQMRDAQKETNAKLDRLIEHQYGGKMR